MRLRRSAIAATAFAAAVLACAPAARAQTGTPGGAGGDVSARLARADAAYAAGDRERAEREYAALLAADPSHSRAVFRLAQLRQQRDRAAAIALYRRYVGLEPRDPWGFIALGDALAAAGDAAAALAAYDDAMRLAPAERDVRIGRARVLARTGRTDASIAEYRRWLALRPDDTEARRELAAQRRRAGQLVQGANRPAVEPRVSGSRDSDGLTTTRVGVTVTSPLVAGARLFASVSGGGAGDGTFSRESQDATVGVVYRPLAQLRLEGAAGLARSDRAFIDTSAAAPLPGGPGRGPGAPIGRSAPAGETSFATVAVGRARLAWRRPGDGLAVDVRAGRQLLDVSPFLTAQGVLRDEVQVALDARIRGPFRVRGLTRTGVLHNETERNRRRVVGGALAYVPGAFELSLRGEGMAYDAPTTLAYFAPRRAHTVELTTYTERETAGGTTFALDLGAGGQRVTQWASAAGAWSPAFRGWAQVSAPLAKRVTAGAEIEAYDSRFGIDGQTMALPGARWRYVAAHGSLKLAF